MNIRKPRLTNSSFAENFPGVLVKSSVSILGPEMNEVTRETTDLKSNRKCRGYRSNCYNCEKKA